MPGWTQKDAGFIWSLYHGAIAVNMWRHRINPYIPITCSCCPLGIPETLLQCFFECPCIQYAWTYTLTILYKSQSLPPDGHGCWPVFTFQQCVFGSRILTGLNQAQRLWSFLYDTTLWQCWIARNAQCFSREPWSPTTLEIPIWTGILDIAKPDW
jgi:hypothetical protein